MQPEIKLSERESPPTDAELLYAYRRGDSKAFEKLLRRHERLLFTFIVRMVSNKDDAEDIFQETLARVVQNIRSYDEQGKLAKWIFGIAHHLCIDRIRKEKRWKAHFTKDSGKDETDRQGEVMDPEPLADVLLEQKELNEMIAQALQHLAPEQREVFLLRQHSDLTFREIAEMVNRPLNTVLGQMRLAVLSIRAFLLEKMK